jgi:hypothetical protein
MTYILILDGLKRITALVSEFVRRVERTERLLGRSQRDRESIA